MKIIIHRGTHQIGGCVTEIKTDHTRIFVDMGAELPGETNSTHLDIEGVTKGIPSCNAVFLTHYHSDHTGMYNKILSEIPVYMGEVSKEIFAAYSKRIHSDGAERIKDFKTFRTLQKVTIGDISITPIPTDHSAFDSYMFLIESDGKKILHTGDFRTHGFRGDEVIPTIRKYVGTVDVLVTEGTNLALQNVDTMTEYELQQKAKEYFLHNKYVFVICASTHVDRIAAFYHAFYQANPRGRYFICDDYQKSVLDIVTRYAGDKAQVYDFEKFNTYGPNLDEKLKRQGFCMLVRSNDKDKKTIEKLGGKLIYSMWNGYLEGDTENKSLSSLVKTFDSVYHLHTSGHATVEAIYDVCNAVAPRTAIIPIHGNSPHSLDTLRIPYPIRYLNDGEIFSV